MSENGIPNPANDGDYIIGVVDDTDVLWV